MPAFYLSTVPRLLCVTAVIAMLPYAGSYAQSTLPGEAQKDMPVLTSQPPPENLDEQDKGGVSSGSFLSGEYATSRGDESSAIAYMEKAHAEAPDDTSLSNQLLVLYIYEGRMPDAVKLAKELQASDERELIADLVLIMDHIKASAYKDASAKLDETFVIGQNSLWLPLVRLWLEAGQGKLKKPVTMADVTDDAGGAAPFLNYHLALINDYLNHNAVAELQYEQAVQDKERAPFRAAEALVDFYRRSGKPDKADALIDAYRKAQPANADFLRDVAKARSLRVAGTVQDGVAELLYTMASVLLSVDAGRDTALYLQIALYLRPDFPVASLMLGTALESEEDFAAAARVYGSINPASPWMRKARLRQAFALDRTGQTEQALAMLNEISADPAFNFEASIAKGDLLRTRARFQDAIEAYTAAIDAMPKGAPEGWAVYFARGACYERLKEYGKSDADLKQALALAPNQPEVMNYLGYSWLTRDKNIKEARKLIENAYELKPDQGHIIDSMGYASYKAGDYAKAIEYYEKAIEIMPSDPSVNEHLGDAYWKVGRKTEARYQWKRALTFSPEPDASEALKRKVEEGKPRSESKVLNLFKRS